MDDDIKIGSDIYVGPFKLLGWSFTQSPLEASTMVNFSCNRDNEDGHSIAVIYISGCGSYMFTGALARGARAHIQDTEYTCQLPV